MKSSLLVAVSSFLLLLPGHCHGANGAEMSSKITIFAPKEKDGECFVLSCPKPGSERWRELNERCCVHGGRYHCQNQKIRGILITAAYWTCMKPIRCPAGKFFELRNVEVNAMVLHTACRTCPPGEFQSQAKLSHHFTRPGCQIRKGCTTPGALLLKAGTSTTDDICKCNYLRGYRPVPLAGQHCLHFASLSKCRCIHEPCPEGKRLSPKDYRCVDELEFEADVLKELSRSSDPWPGAWRQYQDYLSEERAVHEQMVNSGWPVCPVDCDNDEAHSVSPPALWTSIKDLDWTGVVTTLSTTQDSTQMLILLLCLFSAVICCVLFARKFLWTTKTGPANERREAMVHFKLQSRQAVATIYEELGNILPLLSRHYGHLKLAANHNTKVISVSVDPNKCKGSFQILHFMRDLLSPESVKKHLTGNTGRRQEQGVEVTVSFPQCPRKHASSNLNTAAPRLGHLKNNSGELILRFDSGVRNERVVSDLNTYKDEIRKVLKGFELELTSISKGSVVIKFHLEQSSQTFDTLALDSKTEQLANELLTNESFKRFRRHTRELSIQFIIKANLQHITAVYSDNLHVQIGKKNNVYTCQHAHMPLDTDEPADGSVQQTEATERQECIANMIKINVLQLSPLPRQPPTSAENRSSDLVRITVSSPSSWVVRLLREEWTNIKSLLQNQHPRCHMKTKGRKIIWELPDSEEKHPDVRSFIGDIFALQRIRDVVRTESVCVDIHIPEWLEDKSRTGRRWMKKLAKFAGVCLAPVELLCIPFCTCQGLTCSCTIILCASIYLATAYAH